MGENLCSLPNNGSGLSKEFDLWRIFFVSWNSEIAAYLFMFVCHRLNFISRRSRGRWWFFRFLWHSLRINSTSTKFYRQLCRDYAFFKRAERKLFVDLCWPLYLPVSNFSRSPTMQTLWPFTLMVSLFSLPSTFAVSHDCQFWIDFQLAGSLCLTAGPISFEGFLKHKPLL